MKKDDHHTQEYAVNLLKTLWSKPYVTFGLGTARFVDVPDDRSWHTAEYFHSDSDNWDTVAMITEDLYKGMTEQMREHVWDRAYDMAEVIEKIMVFSVGEVNGIIDPNRWWRANNLRGWYVAQLEANRHIGLAMLYTYE